MSPPRRLRATIGPYAGTRLAGQGLEYVGWIVLARRLAPEDFGIVSVAFLLCRYGGLVADWGASIRGARDVAAVEGTDATVAYVRWREKVTAALVVLAVASMVATGHVVLCPVVVVIAGIGMSRDWIALGHQRGGRAGTPVLVQGATIAVAAVTIGLVSGGSLAVGLGYGAGLAVSLLLNRLPTRRGADRLRRPDGWILLVVLAVQVTSTFDTVLLAALRSAADAGIYAAVYRIPNAWYAVLTVVLGALIPRAATVASDREEFYALRRSWLRASGVVAILVLVAAPVAALLVPVLYGQSYASGAGPVMVLMVAHAVMTFFAPLNPLALALSNDRAYATIVTVAAAVNVGLNLVAIPLLGMVGAAVATLVTQLALGLFLWRLTGRLRHPSW